MHRHPTTRNGPNLIRRQAAQDRSSGQIRCIKKRMCIRLFAIPLAALSLCACASARSTADLHVQQSNNTIPVTEPISARPLNPAALPADPEALPPNYSAAQVISGKPAATPVTPPVVERFVFASMPGWTDGDHAPVLITLRDTCPKILRNAADQGIGGQTLNGEPVFGRTSDWRPICESALRADTKTARAFFEKWFEPVSVNGAGKNGSTLYTGYFEPELRGSRVRGGPYQFPIYSKPPDLRSDVPYFERSQIQNGALSERGLELFWIDDPVEAFFLEIQGSGRIRLPDGSVTRVGFAGKNGHAYTAIGKTLVNWNELALEQVTAQSIKDWIRNNPQRRDDLLATNRSYVFFTERPELAKDPSLGPIGTFGTPLPTMRAIAVDRSIYPLGIPFWLDFESPVGPVQRLVTALDTGGAIKGTGRADFFYGSGDGPGFAAGETRARGRLIALAPTAALRRIFRAGS